MRMETSANFFSEGLNLWSKECVGFFCRPYVIVRTQTYICLDNPGKLTYFFVPRGMESLLANHRRRTIAIIVGSVSDQKARV